ncbi:MAG: phosphoenolpyruvate carboxylase, partial [Planctomycetia bacterium]
GGVIVDLAGRDALALIEEIRALSRDRRAGRHDAERALAARIESLDTAQAECVARAFSVYFDLVNIAEDRQRVRVLRERERERAPEPIGESLAAGVAELKARGLSAAEVQQALDRLAIGLVFTAHPSEAKRRSIRAKLRRMRHSLQELDRADLLPRERTAHEADMRGELDVLWQTEFVRPTRPTVLDEVERGLSIMPRLWEAVPQVHASLRRGLAAGYPGESFRIPPFLTFGSWMGGDRDGNPFVTADVTERTLLRLRAAAIERHLDWCARLHDLLTLSLRAAKGSGPLVARLEALAATWPDLAAALEPLASHEVYRRWIRMIRFRLERSRTASLADPPAAAAYATAAELEADVALLVACLERDHGLAGHSPATSWLDLVRTFGLHMTRLDVRQDARAYGDIMGQILAAAGRVPDASAYTALDEPARRELLVASMPGGATAAAVSGDIPRAGLAPLAADTLLLFEVLHRARARFGPACIGTAIISLTRSPADVLSVLWLWRFARSLAATRGEPVADGDIDISPLFEKINDLAHAHDTLAAILDEPCYREHLA